MSAERAETLGLVGREDDPPPEDGSPPPGTVPVKFIRGPWNGETRYMAVIPSHITAALPLRHLIPLAGHGIPPAPSLFIYRVVPLPVGWFAIPNYGHLKQVYAHTEFSDSAVEKGRVSATEFANDRLDEEIRKHGDSVTLWRGTEGNHNSTTHTTKITVRAWIWTAEE